MQTNGHLWGVKRLPLMADRVSRREKENRAISKHVCVDNCTLLLYHFTTQYYAFYNKRLQPLFKDQLDRSKATC